MENKLGFKKKLKGTIMVGGDLDRDGVKNINDAAPMNPNRKTRDPTIMDFMKKNKVKL